jgi:hypothetical protein
VRGCSWLFPPYRWQFGAVAAQRSTAVEFTAQGVRRLMESDDALGRQFTTRFMSVVVDRLHAAGVGCSTCTATLRSPRPPPDHLRGLPPYASGQ